MKKKVMTVFGTRPEAVKICPLVKEMKKREGLEVVVCVTAQHRQMLDQVLKAFDIVPDYDLDIMKDRQSLFDITANILNGIKKILEKEKPEVVLVHGDTSTAFVAALACFYLQIPVGHVEAGLRTYNIYSPYPEEFNREAVGLISRFNFAPTPLARDNLLREGKRAETIYVTGNTVIDAMQHTVKGDYTHPELDWVGRDRLIFITAHRRENLGAPMHHMFRAIRRVLDEHPDCKAVYPIHMNPEVREAAETELGSCDRIHIIEPMEVFDCHNFEARSFLCLTDSGGIQEECPSYGVPVLVMRDTTERPEGLEAGTLRLVGTDEETIYRNFKELLEKNEEYEKMSRACNPYGDGHACERIANVLEKGTYEPWSALPVKQDKLCADNQQDNSLLFADRKESLVRLTEGASGIPDVLGIICRELGCSGCDIAEIEVLKKGMTNRSILFRVSRGGSAGRYIMRIPGAGTGRLINRKQEAEVFRTISGLGLCDDPVYLNPEDGCKITKYLEGARVCCTENTEDLKLCMEKLRDFHNLHLSVAHTFDLFGQIDFYESLWEGSASVYGDYEKTKKNVMSLKTFIDGVEKDWCLTHIDAVPDNFLFYTLIGEKEERLQLTDWEYAGMQDPHVDIAMFCIYSLYHKEQCDRLIDIYFQDGCGQKTRAKIYCYIAVCGLLWSNWCEYKRKLGVEFGEYSIRQYRFAKDFYGYARELLEVEAAGVEE